MAEAVSALSMCDDRDSKLQMLREELPLVQRAVTRARQEVLRDPVAGISEIACLVKSICQTVFATEIGNPGELTLSKLAEALNKDGFLPNRMLWPIQVVALHWGQSAERLASSLLFGSVPGPTCLAALGRLASWYLIDYLGIGVPAEMVRDLAAFPRHPAMALARPQSGAAEDGGGERSGDNERVRTAPRSLFPPLHVHPHQEEAARQLGIPVAIEDEATGMAMVLLPSGEFWMGASPGDKECCGSETPRHRVRLRPFYCGVGPVLQREWQRVMGINPSDNRGPGRPVERVSWLDAQEFMSRAHDGRRGPPLRLLTEAEWEVAARGGTETAYWWGPTYREGGANCSSDGLGSGLQETSEVGLFPVNPFGLLDMLGNVWEFCEDGWHSDYQGAPAFAVAREPLDETSCVRRGGSWSSFPDSLRVSSRFGGWTRTSRDGHHGFRCARSVAAAR